MSLDLHQARQTMVETQVRPNDVTDPLIQSAMRAVPREVSCGANVHLAYADTEVNYAPGRWLQRPRDVAKLLQNLAGRPGEKALAIAAPYAGAVLKEIGLDVEFTDHLGPVNGAYDVIVCEGAVAKAPASWTSALNVGGRLGVVEREGTVGKARIYLKTEDGVGVRTAFESAAVVLADCEPEPAFVL